jgi:hypothetical protein
MLGKLVPKIQNFYKLKVNFFTGKTQTGWKFTTPLIKMKSINPIFPPPGFNLEIPSKFILI